MLEDNHPRSITAKFGPVWACDASEEDQLHVIKFVSDLRQVDGFFGYSGFLYQ